MAAWALPAKAQILVWSGGNGGNANNWGRAQNWTPNGPPSGTETAQFDDTADVSNLAPSIAAVSRSVGDITFSSGTTNAYNISGSATLTVNNSAGITNASATSQTFSVSTLALGGSQTWSPTSTGNLTFSSAVSLGANTLTLDGSNTGTGSISGVVSGTGSLLKSGSTTWTLSGTNTYTGVTTLNAGTLSVATIGNGGVAGNLGQATNAAANLVLGGGTLLYTGATASTDRAFTLTNATTSTISVQTGGTNLTISGAGAATSGGLTKAGAGTLTLSGANAFTGLTTVSAGTLAYGASNALSTGDVTVDGATSVLAMGTFSDSVGTVTLSNSGSITGSTGVLTSTGTFELQSGTVSAILGGSGIALNKTTSGTVTLSGVNTFTGLTTVSAGTLAYGASNVLSTGAVTVDGGTAILDLGASRTDTVGTVTVANGGSITGTGTSALTSTGTFEMQNGSVTAILAGAGIALNKTTSGTVTLSGANTFTGLTTVSAGTLAYGASNVLSTGAVTVDGATAILDLGASRTDSVGIVTVANGGSITGTGTSALTSTGGFAVQSGSASAILSGAVALTKSTAGTFTLSGVNTYTGGTTLSAGTLQLSGSGTLGGTSGVLTLSGGTLDLNGVNTSVGNFTGASGTVLNNGGAATLTIGTGNGTGGNFQGVLADGSGALALTKIGTGTITISGANTYTGGTIVNAGTLTLGASNSLSSGTVTVDGATAILALGANSDTVGTVTLANGGTISGTGALSTTGTFELQSGTVSGVLGGSGNLNKTTAGTVTLTGTNTFTGSTNVNGGTLSINSDARLGTAPGSPTTDSLTFNGGTLSVTATTTLNANRGITLNAGGGTISPTTGTTSYAGIIAGSGNLTKTGAGALTLSGANTYTGQTFVAGTGALSINTIANVGGGASALGAPVTIANGTIALGSGATAGLLTYTGAATSTDRVVDLAGTTGGATISANGSGALTFASNFTATGNGDKTLTLGGTNTGANTISGILPDSAGGTTSLLKTGAGLWVLSGANTYSGTTQIQGGTLSINSIGNVSGGATALGAPTTIGNGTIKFGLTTTGASLTYTGSGASTDRVIDLAGTTGGATINANQTNGAGALVFTSNLTATGSGAKTLALAGTNTDLNTISGTIGNSAGGNTAVSKSGAGTWLLSGTNSYSGNTTLTVGTLVAGNDSAFGNGTLSFGGGTLQGDGTPRTLTNALAITANSTIAGSSNLTLSGNFNLGTTTRTLTVTNTGSTVLSGILSNTAGLTKAGAGSLTLSGDNTYTGTTTLSAGTLRASGFATALGGGNLALNSGILELANDTGLTFGRNTTIGGNTTIKVDTVTAQNGVTHTLGTLTTGAFTLSVAAGANVNANTAYGLTFGSTVLSGNPAMTVNVANNGSGLGTVTLGSLSNAAARGLTKTGDGLLLLSAASGTITSTSAFTVNNGTLRLGAAGALGASALANVTVNATTAGTTALFDLAGNNQSILSLTFGGTGATATSTNSVTTGAGTLTLGGNVTYTSTNNPLGATLTGNLNLGAATRTFTINDSNNAAVDLAVSADISASAAGLTKLGSGTLELSGANAYTGTTTVSLGTLRATTSASALGAGALTLNAGTLQLVDDTGLAFGRNTTVAASSTIQSDRLTVGSNVSNTLGTLSIGTFTLTANAGGNVSGTATTTFGATTLTGNASFTVGANSNLVLGALTDGGVARTLTKSGLGTLTLGSAAASWATANDALVIATGTVRLGASDAFGTGTNTNVTVRSTTAGATSLLDLNGSNQSIGTLTFGGTGSTATSTNSVSTGSGTLTLGGNVTYSATSNPLGSTLSGNLNLGSANRTFTIADSTNAPIDLDLTANISGTGGLIKAGAGTLAVSGNNTLTGTTSVTAGTLRATANAAALGAGNLTLGGGTLQLADDTGLAFNRNTTLTANTTLQADRLTAGSNVSYTFGTLSLGAFTLTANAGANVSGTATTIFGATTLTGNATLAVGNLANLRVGSLDDGGVARTLTKTGLGTLTLTSTASNWNTASDALVISNGTVQLAAADVFGSTGNTAVTVRANTASTTALLDLNGNSATIGSLTFGGAGSTTTSTNTVTTGAGTLTLGGDVTYSATSNPLGATLTGNVNLGSANRAFTIGDSSNASTDLAVSAIISGSGVGLNKAGAGVLELSGNNTFTGTTTVSAGTLRATTSAGALGAGTLALAGGTLQLVDDTGLAFGRDTTVTGSATVTADRATAGSDVTHTLGNLSIGAFTLTANAGANVSGTGTMIFGGTTLTGDATFDVGALAQLNLGTTTGAFGFTKSGVGTLVLGGGTSNTYSGTTTVNGGTLVLAKSGGAIAVSGNLVIGDGTGTDTVRLDAANQISDTSAVTLNATGAPVLNLNGFAERIGSLSSANAAAEVQFGSPGSLTNFTIGDASDTTYAGVLTSGNSNTSLVKEGTGTLTLSGANTFTGAVAVNDGTLAVQNNSGLGAGTLGTTVSSGGTLALLGGVTVANGTLSLTGTGASSVGALTNVSGDNVWNGDVTLTGDAFITTQAGTLIIGPTNPYTFTPSGTNPATETGYVTIGGRTLTFGGAGTNIQVYDRIRDFVGQTDSTRYSYPPLTLAQAPETTSPGNVIVNMTGGGSVTYSANANSYTGSTTVQAGTLILDTVNNTGAQHDTVTNNFHAINGALIIGNGDASTATVQLSNGYPVAEAIAMTSAITMYKDGVLDINGQSQTIGALTFNGGTVNLNAGTLYLDQDVTVNASAGNTATINGTGNLSLTLRRTGGVDVLPDATRTFTVTGGVGNLYDLTITGNIQSGNLVKAGDGTLMLGTTHNTYVGTTSVTGGILNIQQGTDGSTRSSLGASNGLASQGTSVSSGATLQLQGGISVTGEYLSIAGNGFNPGGGDLGALNNLSGSNTWGTGGNTYINLTADSRINSSAGTLTIAGNISSTGNRALTFGGAGDTTVSGGINTGTGSTTTVTKDGAGTLILSGSNNFEGVTNVTSGIVSVQHNNGLGSVVAGTVVTSGAELQLSKVTGLSIGGEALTLNGAGISGTSGALNNVLGNNSFGGVVTLGSATTIKSTSDTLTLSGGITSSDQNLTIAGTGNVTVTGGITNGTGTLTKNDAGTFTFAGSVNGTTGTVGTASLLAGSMVVGNGTETTTLNTAAFDSAAGTTLTIASGGTVVADYASGSTNFDGALAGAGTFQKNGAGTLVFGNSFTATNLTLVLHGGTLSLTGVQITVGTIHITASTTLDFNNSNGTVLNSSHLVIDNGVVVTVNNWISAANDAAASTIWYATSTVNSGSLTGAQQFGGTPLTQIEFTGYTPGLTTTWTTQQNGWFEHEIRPTPEPQTYGAIFLSGCFGLLGWRRWRQRRVTA